MTEVYPLCAEIDPTGVFLMLNRRRKQYTRSAIALAEPDPQVLLADMLQPLSPVLSIADAEVAHDEAIEEQVRNRALPKDASKLPLFRGDDKDSKYVDTFLRSLRRYFRVNASSYASDPNDELKLSTCGACFPLDSLACIWFDYAEDDLESYDKI